MEFQEYPKALYRDGEFVVVEDEAQETKQAEDGYTDWISDQARMQGAESAPAKRTRAKKTAEAESAPVEEATETTEQAQ